MSDIKPDWENFAKAILTDWPTGDLDGSVLFDLSLQYGMIKEVPGGYNADHHIDVDCICPEEGDPWYEYTFRGEAGPGRYSITDMTRRIEELEAKLAKAVEEKLNAIDTLEAWFDRRKLAHDAVDQAVVGAASGYLRTSRVGGMPQKESDLVLGVIQDMARLSVFADLFARTTLAELTGEST